MARPRAFDEADVLDRAMDVFWRHGYEGASMAGLTQAMGINSPSIYAAFGSKRGLFDAVLGRYRDRRAAYTAWLLAGPTARDVAERMLYGAVEWLVDRKEPRGCLMIQSGLSACDADIPRTFAKLRSGFAKVLAGRLKHAQEEGDLSACEDPAELARYLLMVFLGLGVQAAEGATKAELRKAAERALMGWPTTPPTAGASL